MQKPQDEGMLGGVLSSHCRQIERTVPYFEDISELRSSQSKNYSGSNEYLTEVINTLHD
jgi:hypothetical protein